MCLCAVNMQMHIHISLCSICISMQYKYCIEIHKLHYFCLYPFCPASQYRFCRHQRAALFLKTNVPTLPLKMASLGRNTWNSPNLVTRRFHCRPRCSRGLISVKKSLTRDMWARTCSVRGSFTKPGVSKRSGNWNRPKKELRTWNLVINWSVDKHVTLWRQSKSSRRAAGRVVRGFIHSTTQAAGMIAGWTRLQI